MSSSRETPCIDSGSSPHLNTGTYVQLTGHHILKDSLYQRCSDNLKPHHVFRVLSEYRLSLLILLALHKDKLYF